MSVFDDLVGQQAAIDTIMKAALAARQIVAGRPAANAQPAARNQSATGGQQASSREASGSALAVASSPTAQAQTPANAPLITDSAMSHAWLFTGPPGSGRSLAARTFAAALQCTGPEPGCGVCAQCRAVMDGNHPDVLALSTDQVTISVEEVRQYVASSYQAPGAGNWKVFIVEDADRMLTRTSNVLLKAIEEPGPRTVWMLSTAAVADVLPTIRSRTRNINLVTPSPAEVAALLERSGVDPERALVAAHAAQSHIGVARALATDESAAKIRTTTLNAVVAIRSVGDAALAAALLADPPIESDDEEDEAEKLAAMGLDPGARIPAAVRAQVRSAKVDAKRRATRRLQDTVDRELIYVTGLYRDVLVSQLGAQVDLINADYARDIAAIAADSTPAQTLERISALDEARQRLRQNVTVQLLLEAALMRLVPRGRG